MTTTELGELTDKSQVLLRAAANASVVAQKCASMPERMPDGDPLMMLLKMLGEVTIALQTLAESVHDACHALAIDTIAETVAARAQVDTVRG